MRRGILALFVVLVLVVGGYLTIQLATNGPSGALPVRVQTDNPEASTLVATPNQALAFIIFAVVALASMAGGGFVLAFIIRYLDRKVEESKKEASDK